MLQIATLLPAPHGVQVTDEGSLWEEIARPFLETVGYGARHIHIVDQRDRGDVWPTFYAIIHHTRVEDMAGADLVMVLDARPVIPGELLDRAIEWAQQQPHSPPLLALVYPQRNGFVLAAFHAATRMPIGVTFPSPSALQSLAAGLRRVSIPQKDAATEAPKLQDSLLEARLQRDTPLATEILGELAQVYQVQGRYSEACETLTELLAIHRSHGNAELRASTLKMLGQVEMLLQRFPAAEAHLMESLEVFQALGDQTAEAATLVDLGGVYLCQQSYEAAEGCLDRALSFCRESEDLDGEGAVLNNLAHLGLATGAYKVAAENLERSLEISRALGEPREEVITLYNLAVAYTYLGREAQAARLVREVRRLSDMLEDPPVPVSGS